MDSSTQTRTASMLAALVGIWLLISPAFISTTGQSLVSQLIVGAVITLASLTQLVLDNPVPSWVNGLAAAWLVVSAFVLPHTTTTVWNQVIAAAVAIVLSVWDGYEVGQVQRTHPARV